MKRRTTNSEGDFSDRDWNCSAAQGSATRINSLLCSDSRGLRESASMRSKLQNAEMILYNGGDQAVGQPAQITNYEKKVETH